MSRHLLIGTGATSNVSSGVEVDGAVSFQKMTESGPAALELGDSIADAPQIRVIQGTSGNNIVSPWFYGRDVIDFSGKSYVAPTACTVTDTIASATTSAGTLVLKFVRLDGPRPEFFSFATEIADSVAHTAADAVIKTAFEDASLVKPDWLNPVCDATAGSTVVFSGAKRGDTAYSGNSWDYAPVQLKLIVESYDGTGQTHTASTSANASPGVGGGYAVKAFEDALMGVQYGYYNRVELPIAPANTAVVGSTYDMYHIAATKDGSSNSQINGVDNLIEINIAMPEGSDADRILLENTLNGYFTGEFPSVIL